MNKKPSIKRLTFSFIIFILLIIVTSIVLFNNNDFNASLLKSKNIIPDYIFISCLCSLFFIIGEAINIKIILKYFNHNINILKAIKYSFIGFFFSAITPSASGGQPMQIYYMSKDKISVSDSAITLMLQFVCFQIISIILGTISYIFNINVFNTINPAIKLVLITGITLNLIILIIILLFMFSKNTSLYLIKIILKILKIFKFKNTSMVELKLRFELYNYHKNANIIKTKKFLFLKVISIVAVQFICSYSIPYFIYLSFGLNDLGYLNIFSMQAVLFLTVSSLPLPGGIGVTESGFIILYRLLFKADILGSALALNRLISFYFPLTISIIILLVYYISMLKTKH